MRAGSEIVGPGSVRVAKRHFRREILCFEQWAKQREPISIKLYGKVLLVIGTVVISDVSEKCRIVGRSPKRDSMLFHLSIYSSNNSYLQAIHCLPHNVYIQRIKQSDSHNPGLRLDCGSRSSSSTWCELLWDFRRLSVCLNHDSAFSLLNRYRSSA